nr:DUF2380 domain-containing protein [Acidobacterium sp. S8]
MQRGTRSYTGMAEAPEHHILPKEKKYRAWFKKRGIGRNEIHKVTVKLPQWEHEAIHGGGDWQTARKLWEGEWNRNMMENLYEAERHKGSLLTPREIGMSLIVRFGNTTYRENLFHILVLGIDASRSNETLVYELR